LVVAAPYVLDAVDLAHLLAGKVRAVKLDLAAVTGLVDDLAALDPDALVEGVAPPVAHRRWPIAPGR
jgi:hypothetical protein